MSTRTHPFTHDALLACAKRELAMRRAVYPGRVNAGKMPQHEADHETDAMEAIVAVLESYPLASVADVAVRIVCEDLSERKGFSELIEECGTGWRDIRAFLVEKVARSIVYTEPVKPAATMEMNFDAPAALPAEATPAESGETMEFA